jgi:hypothetical protein
MRTSAIDKGPRRACCALSGIALLLAFATSARAADDESARPAEESTQRQAAIDAIEADHADAISLSRTRFFIFAVGGMQAASYADSAPKGLGLVFASPSPTFGGGVGIRFPIGVNEGQVRATVSTWSSTASCPGCTATVTAPLSFTAVAFDATMRLQPAFASPVFFGFGPRVGFAAHGAVYSQIGEAAGTPEYDSAGSGGLLMLHGLLEGGVLLLDNRLELAVRAEAGYDIGGAGDFGVTFAPAFGF